MSSNERTGAAAAGCVVALLGGASAWGAIDLAALEVTPQRGQTAEQARRDRYECHNWAIDQTGVVPLAAPVQEEREEDADRNRRAERIHRVLNGAAIGAALGGLVRATQDRNSGQGALAGAAVGAAVGAATGRRDRAAAGAADAGETEYVRALSACLEGRGYSVALPDAPAPGEEIVAAR